MKHIITVLAEKESGFFIRLTSLLYRRHFNIESLTYGNSENDNFIRATIITSSKTESSHQVVKQINKLWNTIAAYDITVFGAIQRETLLLKVESNDQIQSKIIEQATIANAKVIDVNISSIIMEITGERLDLIRLETTMKEFNILQSARTGVVSLPRASFSEPVVDLRIKPGFLTEPDYKKPAIANKLKNEFKPFQQMMVNEAEILQIHQYNYFDENAHKMQYNFRTKIYTQLERIERIDRLVLGSDRMFKSMRSMQFWESKLLSVRELIRDAINVERFMDQVTYELCFDTIHPFLYRDSLPFPRESERYCDLLECIYYNIRCPRYVWLDDEEEETLLHPNYLDLTCHPVYKDLRPKRTEEEIHERKGKVQLVILDREREHLLEAEQDKAEKEQALLKQKVMEYTDSLARQWYPDETKYIQRLPWALDQPVPGTYIPEE